VAGPNQRFETDKVIVGCLGVLPLTKWFRDAATSKEAATGSYEKYCEYFKSTDPFQILVDAFNATPDGIQAQETIDSLQRHLTLLLFKSKLQPIGSDKLWMRFETARYKGIIAGDTSLGRILVTLYLPGTEDSADLVVFPKSGAKMDDVYQTIAEWSVDKE
jgi:hypothetical protein